MEKILITGGAGFIGKNLALHLLSYGKDITVIDNFSTSSEQLPAALTHAENFKLIKQDIRESINIKCDKIYHLACPASPPKYMRDPIDTLDTCYIGTKNILELAHKNSATILLASTSEIYGDPAIHPQPEGYYGNVNTIGPRSCYDEGKRICETLFYEYEKIRPGQHKIARIFNTYGPHMDPNDGRVITNFIGAMLRGENLEVYGDGQQTRSFCYIDDMVDGLTSLMNSQHGVDPINLGNDKEFTIMELITLISSALKTKNIKNINYQPLMQNDPIKRKPDLTKAQSTLAWSPKIPLEKGLKETIKFIQETL